MKDYTIRDLIVEMLNICYKPFNEYLNKELIKAYDSSSSYENFRFRENRIKKQLKTLKLVKYAIKHPQTSLVDYESNKHKQMLPVSTFDHYKKDKNARGINPNRCLKLDNKITSTSETFSDMIDKNAYIIKMKDTKLKAVILNFSNLGIFVEDVDKAWFSLCLNIRMSEILENNESNLKLSNILLWDTIKYILTTKWGIEK